MTYLRQFCAAAVLTFALALSAFAGDIECGAVPPPPQASIMGDIHCGFTATNETPSTETAFVDPVTGLTLDILQSVFSLL